MQTITRSMIAAATAMLVAVPSSAAVRYQASIQGIGTIDYTVADFIAVNPTDVSPAAAHCMVLPIFTCTNVRFLPNPFGADTLAINYSSVVLGQAFTAAGSFAPGSFGAEGSYVSTAPDTTSTLTVSVVTAVPELSTWAAMVVGFGLVGGVLRRRHAHARLRVRFV